MLIQRLSQFCHAVPATLSRSFCLALPLFATLIPAGSANAQAARTPLAVHTVQSFPSATDKGQLADSTPLEITMTLKPAADRQAALSQFLIDVATAGSPGYRQWVTPAQFASRFGATADQQQAATAWVLAQGLTVSAVSPSATRMTVTGSASQMQAAFGTTLHTLAVGQTTYFAAATQPSLDDAATGLFSAVDGLDNMPLTGLADSATQTVLSPAVLGRLVDANASSMLALRSSLCSSDLSTAQIAAYTYELQQAVAQGITVLSTRACTTGAFPAALPEVTGVTLPGGLADNAPTALARPGWQTAPGLPADSLRHAPDLTVSSLGALTSALQQIAGGGRLGNLNSIFYQLAPVKGLFTQPDLADVANAPTGTWEQATGLGLIDVGTLIKVFPRGTSSSSTTFAATNYSPIHGQGTTLSSTVQSNTGGAVPTGTVSFTTPGGTNLGTVALVNGAASLTLTNLEGGNISIMAVYSGDGTYATSFSAPLAQLYVQPEPSQLAASISGQPVVGSTYTVTVTDTAGSGVGTPTGGISVTVQGVGTMYAATLSPSGGNTSSASVQIPATTPGTLTLSINCTASPDFSCTNPYTTTVTIAKATPTLSISYSPNPVVSGQNVTLNAVVSTVGSAPVPTGNVLFFDNGTTLNSGALSGGATTATGVVTQASSHTITASYGGDPNYNAVSTTAGSTTSGTISTTLSLAASANTVTAGQNITFTATLAPSSTGPAPASGSVTFFDGAVQIGIANLAGSVSTFTTGGLSSTTNHSITAMYSGDGYYSASTSLAVGLSRSNTANTTTTTIAVSPAAPVHGQTITFTAAVQPVGGGAAATGTVTFQSTQTGTLGTGTLQNGVASFSTNQLPGGTYTVNAVYAGDPTYSTSTSSAASFTINPEAVTLSITPPVNAVFGTAFQVLVTATGASGVSYPQGMFTVTPQGTGYSASVTGSVQPGKGSSSTGAATVQANGAGTITFTATYAGDKNFAAAGPVSSTGTVAKATPTTTLSFTPTSPIAGQATTLTARVSFAGSIAPTGTVQFLDGNTVLGTATLDSTGTATLSTVFTAGNHAVSAVYNGDTNYAGSTSATRNTSTGSNATTTSITVNPATVTAGTPVTLGATVTPAVNGTVPTGTVQFVGGGAVLCTVTLTNGSTTCSYTPVAATTVQITANYQGDSTYAASTSAAATLTVNNVTGALTATITPSTGASGGTASLVATVAAPVGTIPSGMISAAVTSSTGMVVGTYAATLAAGTSNVMQVTVPVTIPVSAGTYTVTVTCVSANVNCTPVTLSLISTGTTKISTVTTLTMTAPAAGTNTVALTATVTPASQGAAALSGTVVFFDNMAQVGSAVVVNGVATVSVTSTGTSHSYVAVYSGDTLYATSSSTGTTAPAATTPTISLTVSASNGLAGAPVVLTASIAGITATGAIPTGTVAFYAVGSTPSLLGTVTVGKAGTSLATGVFSTSNLPAGTTAVYAVYSGDTNFTTVTSSSVAVGFSDYTVTFVPPSLTLTSGKSGQTTLILGAINGFTGIVTFGCTPPPNTQITCSFSPTTLTGGGSTTLTINTVANKARGTQQAGLRIVGGVSFAALLLCLIPGRSRRRVPALLLMLLLAAAATANIGCGSNTFDSGNGVTGTPLGTTIITVVTASSDGVNTVKHNYTFPVTIQ